MQTSPGAWDIRASKDGSGDVGITAPGYANVIAECFAEARVQGDVRPVEALANARLMSAAPELLRELRTAAYNYHHRAHRKDPPTRDFDVPFEVCPGICAEARAAIEKATGESLVPA